MTVRKINLVERRFIAEYLAETFPQGNFKSNVELGSIDPEAVAKIGLYPAAQLIRSWRRRIDAVAWEENKYYLIEAKIRDPFEGVGRLHTYYNLALSTPDLPQYQKQPFIKRLVVPMSLPWIIQAAQADDIEVVEYWRDWIADYVKERQEYHTLAYRQSRHDKLRTREIFGVE